MMEMGTQAVALMTPSMRMDRPVGMLFYKYSKEKVSNNFFIATIRENLSLAVQHQKTLLMSWIEMSLPQLKTTCFLLSKNFLFWFSKRKTRKSKAIVEDDSDDEEQPKESAKNSEDEEQEREPSPIEQNDKNLSDKEDSGAVEKSSEPEHSDDEEDRRMEIDDQPVEEKPKALSSDESSNDSSDDE